MSDDKIVILFIIGYIAIMLLIFFIYASIKRVCYFKGEDFEEYIGAIFFWPLPLMLLIVIGPGWLMVRMFKKLSEKEIKEFTNE